MKLLAKSNIISKLLTYLLATIFKLIGCTVNIQLVIKDEEYWDISLNKACLLTFWHDQQIPVIWINKSIYKIFKQRPIHALVSQHADGRLAANVIKVYGVSTVDGSSSSGGREAMLKMRSLLRNKITLAITPDGPRGPKHVAKLGFAKLAHATNTPVFCCAVAAKNVWHFKSWDKLFLPKPFTTVLIVFEKFTYVPTKTGNSEHRRPEEVMADHLTMKLNNLTEEASQMLDKKVGF